MRKAQGAMLLAVACLAAYPLESNARTPLNAASQALISPEGNLRFVAYGETSLAPIRIFRDDQRTYIQLGKETGQRVDVYEVTSIGYRRIPSTVSESFLAFQGFASSLALSYPGRNLVFIEFAPEAMRQPASAAEMAVRMQDRSQALLAQQTRLDLTEQDVSQRARAEKSRADEAIRNAEQQRAAAEQAARHARADLEKATAERSALAAERTAWASRPPQRAFDVYRADGQLKNVLTRWARNDGLDLVWSAPEDPRHNPEVEKDGPVDAATLKDAMQKLLGAFARNGVQLRATFFNDGIVEITQREKK